MARSPTTVDDDVAALPEDRRAAIRGVRREFDRRLPKGYEEGLRYGVIAWFVPRHLYPAGYHCDPKPPLPFACPASRKGHMSLSLMCVYGDERHRRRLRTQWAKTGKKLDMGKSCIRFKKLDDLPLELIGEAVARVPVAAYLKRYEAARKSRAKRAKA